MLCLLHHWENAAAGWSAAGACCKDWGAPCDPAAEHSMHQSFPSVQAALNTLRINMCGQLFTGYS